MDGLVGKRIVLWGMVALYAAVLPYVINAYDALVSAASVCVADAVPRVILVTAGIAYVFYAMMTGHAIRSVMLVVPCAVAAGVVIVLEPNQAKHIHIPEYILMGWLVFQALRIDYSDGGLYLSAVLVSLILGVADEIHQGVHPMRFYGWPDMVINGISSVIGVVTAAGVLERFDADGWKPPRWLSPRSGSGAFLLTGMASIAVNGWFLLGVAGSSGHWLNFPDRLAAWDMVLVVSAGIGFTTLWKKKTAGADGGDAFHRSRRAAAGALLILTAVIHLMIIVAVLTGAEFR